MLFVSANFSNSAPRDPEMSDELQAYPGIYFSVSIQNSMFMSPLQVVPSILVPKLQLRQLNPIHSAYVDPYNLVLEVDLQHLDAAGWTEVVCDHLFVELILCQFIETSGREFERCTRAISTQKKFVVN